MPKIPAEVVADPVALTRALVDIESVSGNEQEITDAVEAVLRSAGHLNVERAGNVLCARTALGRPSRVILAGHLDTVPVHGNLPSTVDGDLMYGCGTADMKARLGAGPAPRRDAWPSRPSTSPTSSTTARRSRPSATGSTRCR